ncbi:MAG: beta-ketoacyl-[acyl-carrier-protein] synthase II [Candidatus Lindowbacteria bacterium RIFCSPLOWO2_12_FULL_62_27]|nr:MAG: beta-ketoacyl-[acyl-carrier-protein] synthase II [Candidatus Lindowbacteria bacterium RIFCSPLOWO2_12_FULL_62_27]OGH61871.1 MAG: beta-ketoacyl-[acyl-carrier-protein] synthase II [Candidatus Lindowbacteria bacterium RIFCSPLOWO2_02_FULL_62_12]
MNRRRVVVTGAGVAAPNGIGVRAFWESLAEGRSGIKPITILDAAPYPTRFGGEISDFDPLNHFDKNEARKLDRFAQFALVACREAVEQSKLGEAASQGSADRIGVVFGSGMGGFTTIEEQHRRLIEHGPRRVYPFLIPMMIVNIAAGEIAIRHGFKGPNTSMVSACTTGNHCLGYALRTIQCGDADAMVAGASEAGITHIALAGFSIMRALSTRNDDPSKASRPFDKDRDGFVLSEGAGVLILEEHECAVRRGAPILAEITGYAANSDAHHITAPCPDGEGARNVMRLALADAGLKPEDIDYINAHGTSTQLNDKSETLAIKEVFGDHARKVRISSTKSVHGHLLGAGAAVEAVACVQALRDNVVPPTINYTTPDPDCDLNYTPNVKVSHPIRHAMSNAFGFGGHNASIIFKKYGNDSPPLPPKGGEDERSSGEGGG